MRSKCGLHMNALAGRDAEFLSFIAEAKPMAILVLFANEPWLREALAIHPTMTVIQRRYVNDQPLGNPVGAAHDMASKLVSSSIYPVIAEHGGFWVGYNELSGFDHDQRVRYNEFDCTMAELAHGYGVKYLCGSWSVGRLHVDLQVEDPMYEWRDMYPSIRASDGISAHIYNAPRANDPRDCTVEIVNGLERDVWWRIGRPELEHDLFPDDLKDKPWYLLEGIVDSGAAGWDPGGHGGWGGFMSPEDHIQDISWVDEFYAFKDYVKCFLLFGWGTEDPKWDTFDPSKPPLMFNLLMKYLKDKNTYLDIDDHKFQEWLSEESQKHVIPMAYGTAFRAKAVQLGLSEAMSDEFYPVPGEVVSQVYHHRAERNQYILYTRVGEWDLDKIRVIVRPN